MVINAVILINTNERQEQHVLRDSREVNWEKGVLGTSVPRMLSHSQALDRLQP